MDIKDLILIGGGLLIVAVILHGLWIAWQARREPLRLDIAPGLGREDYDELELLRGELPNGGGRVRGNEAEQRRRYAEAGSAGATPPAEDRKRPVVEYPEDGDPGEGVPSAASADEADDPAAAAAPQAPAQGMLELTPPEGVATAPASPPERRRGRPRVTDVVLPDETAAETAASDEPIVTDPGDRGRSVRPPTPAPRAKEPAELVVLHVLNTRQPFAGVALCRLFQKHGLRYGDMNIFHAKGEDGRALYSVASAVEPGTFDLSDIENYATPGVSFFMKLGEDCERPGAVLEAMLAAAQDIIGTLGGDLKDEQRNPVTGQTIEHYRARVADFARRRLTAGHGG